MPGHARPGPSRLVSSSSYLLSSRLVSSLSLSKCKVQVAMGLNVNVNVRLESSRLLRVVDHARTSRPFHVHI